MLKSKQAVVFLYLSSILGCAQAAVSGATGPAPANRAAATGLSTIQAQAISNYMQLATPPDPRQTKDNWLVYFGPTAQEAATNKAAAAKRKYVQKASPLQTIPTKTVTRNVTWKTLQQDKQNVQTRSKGKKAQASKQGDYGY